MILIYLLFCLIVGYINRKTGPIFAMLVGIFGLNYFLNGNDLFLALRSLVALPTVLLANPQSLLFVLIILFLFIFSSLSNLINIDFIIERGLGKLSQKSQRLVVIVLSMFSTNLDLSNSEITEHHYRDFDLNSGILPFVNPMSIMLIFITTLLVMFDSINELSVSQVFLVSLLNIPAIWWLIKTIIQLIGNYEVRYTTHKQNMFYIRPSIDVPQSVKVQTNLNGKVYAKRLLQFLLLPIIPALLAPEYKILFFIIYYLITIIFYSIYLGVKAVYEERIMAEELIYATIRDSILGIGPELISFLLVLVYSSLAYDFINRFYTNVYTTEQLYLLALIGLIIGMITFKDYLFGIAFSLPILLTWISLMAINDIPMVFAVFVSFISIATLIQIYFLIDMNKLTKRGMIDLSYLTVITLSTVLVLYTVGYFVAFIIFILFVLIYLIAFVLILRKVKR